MPHNRNCTKGSAFKGTTTENLGGGKMVRKHERSHFEWCKQKGEPFFQYNISSFML